MNDDQQDKLPIEHPIEAWHRVIRARDTDGLNSLLAEDVTFHSPILGAPQLGRALTASYLIAAFDILSKSNFRYVREIVRFLDALLEFDAQVDGIAVNGADLLKWNGDGQVTDVKVMLRPLDAINAVQGRMAAPLSFRQQTSKRSPV